MLHAPILRSRHLHNTLQRVNSVLRLAHNKYYSKYIVIKVLQIKNLSVVVLLTYSKVYPGPHASRIFNHRSTRQSELSTLFVLRLSACPFSGLVVRRLLLLYCLPDFWSDLLLTYLVSLVLQGVLQTPWIFTCSGFSAVSDMDSLE